MIKFPPRLYESNGNDKRFSSQPRRRSNLILKSWGQMMIMLCVSPLFKDMKPVFQRLLFFFHHRNTARICDQTQQLLNRARSTDKLQRHFLQARQFLQGAQLELAERLRGKSATCRPCLPPPAQPLPESCLEKEVPRWPAGLLSVLIPRSGTGGKHTHFNQLLKQPGLSSKILE